MSANTKPASARREVHYASLQELLDDAERLAQGNVHTVGNWTQGQIYKHIGISMRGALDGMNMKVSWFMRMFIKVMRKRVLTKPMPAGIKLPAEAAAQIVPEASTTVEEGLEELRKSIKRMQIETQRHPSPFLGEMSIEEWNQFHCRHAELHMSFLIPE